MKLERISLKGVTRFREPYTLDLRELGALVALAGPNGAGKTTIMETVPGALYKRLPSARGGLYAACHGTDAYLEAAFRDGAGRCVRVRVKVDAEHSSSEQYVFVNDEPLTTGRSREHLEVVERLFGSEALLLSSVFAAQEKDRSFLKIAKSDRKALLVEMLGLGHLEQLAGEARQRADATTVSLTVTRASLEGLRRELGDRAALEAELATAQEARDLAELALATATREQAEAQERHAQAIKAAAAAKGARDALIAAQRAEGEAEARRARAALALSRLDGEFLGPDQARTRRLVEAQALLAQERAIRESAAAVEQRRAEVEAHAKAVAEAARQRAEAEGAIRTANAKLEAAAATVQQRKAVLADLQRRAELIGQAPCAITDTWIPEVEPPGPTPFDLRATCPLLSDARDAADATEAAQKALAAAQDAYTKTKRARNEAEAAHARVSVPVLAGGWDPAHDARAKLLPTLDQARHTVDQVDDERRAAREAYTVRLHEAQAEEQAAVTSLEAAVLERKKLEGRVSRTADKEVGDARSNYDQVARAVERARVDVREADAAVARLEERGKRLDAVAADLQRAELEEGRLSVEVGDWTLLSRALGKDGVQALEVDAAGPEVARITNELLDACYGSRFSLSFETLREKKSKPGEYIEAFDVVVRDGGAERSVEALSGGEKVIVGEALGLGIAIFNARKNAVQWRSLFRDETAGALDPDNAIRYVDMLRRALALGGFEQILFVSHVGDVVNRADSVVQL